MCDSRKVIYTSSQEGRDLIIKVTEKCVNDICKFCNMNKIANEEIGILKQVYINAEKNIENYNCINRIVITNSNNIFEHFDTLKSLLANKNKLFLNCKEVILCTDSLYIVQKTIDELKMLKKLGIDTINLAIGTGSDRILLRMKKNISQDQIINIGRRIKESGMKLSICIVSGIGGKDRWIEHAIESANVINKLEPRSVRVVPFNCCKNFQIEREIENGTFEKLSYKLTLIETKKLVEHVKVSNCIFIDGKLSNHLNVCN